MPDKDWKKKANGRAYQKEYERRPKVRKRRAGHTRHYNHQIRLEALKAYGGAEPSCMCECGCKENRAVYLDLDHIDNNGAAHRRAIREGTRTVGVNFYRAMKKLGWPKDPPLRVLCVKCNVGRHRNGGQCPELGIIEPRDRERPKPKPLTLDPVPASEEELPLFRSIPAKRERATDESE